MKVYNNKGILQVIICNCCGKEIVAEHGIFKEDSVSLRRYQVDNVS